MKNWSSKRIKTLKNRTIGGAIFLIGTAIFLFPPLSFVKTLLLFIWCLICLSYMIAIPLSWYEVWLQKNNKEINPDSTIATFVRFVGYMRGI